MSRVPLALALLTLPLAAASALSDKFVSLGRVDFVGERRLEGAANHAWLARTKPRLPHNRCRCKCNEFMGKSTRAPCRYGNFKGSVDLLYLRANTCDLDYAIVDPRPFGGTLVGLPEGKMESINPNHHVGFRVMIGLLSDSGICDTQISYVYFRSTDAVTLAFTEGLWPVFAAPRYQENTPLYSPAKALAQAEFCVDTVDLQLGKLWKCRRLSLRPHAGLNFISLRHEWVGAYTGTAFPGEEEEQTRVTRHFSNWGLGPRLGIDCEIALPNCFSISGNIAGALLAGENDSRLSQQDSQTGLFELGSVNEGSHNHLVPYLSGKIGLGYFWWCRCFSLRFELAYEWHHYHELFSRFRYDDQRATGMRQCSSFTLQGMSLGVRITA